MLVARATKNAERLYGLGGTDDEECEECRTWSGLRNGESTSSKMQVESIPKFSTPPRTNLPGGAPQNNDPWLDQNVCEVVLARACKRLENPVVRRCTRSSPSQILQSRVGRSFCAATLAWHRSGQINCWTTRPRGRLLRGVLARQTYWANLPGGP